MKVSEVALYTSGVAPSDPLVDLLDEARAGDHGTARARERWLLRLAEEEATLAGTLLDLAERGSGVAVRSLSGRVSHGAVVAVGTDFVVLRAEDRRDVCVRLGAISTVRPAAGERHVSARGDRPAPLDLLLVEVLAGLAPDRPRVALLAAGELVAGELRAVGADVVTLRLDGDQRALCYVSAAAVDEAVIERG